MVVTGSGSALSFGFRSSPSFAGQNDSEDQEVRPPEDGRYATYAAPNPGRQRRILSRGASASFGGGGTSHRAGAVVESSALGMGTPSVGPSMSLESEEAYMEVKYKSVRGAAEARRSMPASAPFATTLQEKQVSFAAPFAVGEDSPGALTRALSEQVREASASFTTARSGRSAASVRTQRANSQKRTPQLQDQGQAQAQAMWKRSLSETAGGSIVKSAMKSPVEIWFDCSASPETEEARSGSSGFPSTASQSSASASQGGASTATSSPEMGDHGSAGDEEGAPLEPLKPPPLMLPASFDFLHLTSAISHSCEQLETVQEDADEAYPANAAVDRGFESCGEALREIGGRSGRLNASGASAPCPPGIQHVPCAAASEGRRKTAAQRDLDVAMGMCSYSPLACRTGEQYSPNIQRTHSQSSHEGDLVPQHPQSSHGAYCPKSEVEPTCSFSSVASEPPQSCSGRSKRVEAPIALYLKANMGQGLEGKRWRNALSGMTTKEKDTASKQGAQEQGQERKKPSKSSKGSGVPSGKDGISVSKGAAIPNVKGASQGPASRVPSRRSRSIEQEHPGPTGAPRPVSSSSQRGKTKGGKKGSKESQDLVRCTSASSRGSRTGAKGAADGRPSMKHSKSLHIPGQESEIAGTRGTGREAAPEKPRRAKDKAGRAGGGAPPKGKPEAVKSGMGVEGMKQSAAVNEVAVKVRARKASAQKDGVSGNEGAKEMPPKEKDGKGIEAMLRGSAALPSVAKRKALAKLLTTLQGSTRELISLGGSGLKEKQSSSSLEAAGSSNGSGSSAGGSVTFISMVASSSSSSEHGDACSVADNASLADAASLRECAAVASTEQHSAALFDAHLYLVEEKQREQAARRRRFSHKGFSSFKISKHLKWSALGSKGVSAAKSGARSLNALRGALKAWRGARQPEEAD